MWEFKGIKMRKQHQSGNEDTKRNLICAKSVDFFGWVLFQHGLLLMNKNGEIMHTSVIYSSRLNFKL